jgi:hypothetical protein
MADRIQIERKALSVSARPSISRKAIDRTAPDFESMFDFVPEENALDGIEYAGDIQDSADREMSAVDREIAANRAATAERFRIGTDEGYYCVLCFQTTEQRDDFLDKAGWDNALGGGKYLNGLEIAAKLGVKLEIIPIEPRKMRGNVKKFAKMDTL